MEKLIVAWHSQCAAANSIDAVRAVATDIFVHQSAFPEHISCARSVLTEISLSDRRKGDPAPIWERFEVLKRSLKN